MRRTHLLLPLRQAVLVALALHGGRGCTRWQAARRAAPPSCDRSAGGGAGHAGEWAGGGTTWAAVGGAGPQLPWRCGRRLVTQQHSRAASSTIKSSLKSRTPRLIVPPLPAAACRPPAA